jgi:peptidoglycan glycosyltransferase
MASIPQYDPNEVASPESFARLNQDRNAPLFNRATQAGYQPGSTMKVVTATAALESGEGSDTTRSGENGKEISGVPLQNAGGEDFGEIDMTTALTNSVNTWWAEAGEDLGTDTMYKYMDRFGFNSEPPLDYPSDQLAVSGEFGEGGRLLDAGSDEIDVGRMAIGQDKLNVTPLQMAMVVAAVANDGELMEPRLWSKVIDADGREEKLDPERMSRVMSEDSANTLTEMMTDVVNEGTGGAAALAEDQVAGKTGTAEIDIENEINQAWFIGFAPADDPEIAVAATIERTGGSGGDVAAPIAQQVMEVILAQGDEEG